MPGERLRRTGATTAVGTAVSRFLHETAHLPDEVILLPDRAARVADILHLAAERSRDRRDPSLDALQAALLEALHLKRSALVAS